MIYHTVYPDYWYWLRKWLPKWNTNEQEYSTLIVCVKIVMVSVVATENQSWRFFLCCWRRLRQQWAPSGNCLEEVWYWGRRCGRHSHTWWWCRGWWHFSSSPIWYGSWRFKYCPRLPASFNVKWSSSGSSNNGEVYLQSYFTKCKIQRC